LRGVGERDDGVGLEVFRNDERRVGLLALAPEPGRRLDTIGWCGS
jgi:hypothetical protein